MITIGNISLDTKILLAPMAGCTDLAFRLITRECGARFCFFEMIDARSFLSEHPKSSQIIKSHEQDTPIAAQLLGSDPDIMAEAALKVIDHVPVSFIDINSACPVRKVISKKSGAYLLTDKKRLFKIINKICHNVSIPVTVKVRTGFDICNIKEVVALAKGCEDSGASALFIHGRTREQKYRGNVNYSAIRHMTEAVRIPVFGSGNIMDALSAKKMFSETNCSGIIVARGALGNPWIFKEIEQSLLQHATPAKEQSQRKRFATLKKHLSYIEKFKESPQKSKIGYMRKIMLWYLKGFPGVRRARESICRMESYDKLLELIASFHQ